MKIPLHLLLLDLIGTILFVLGLLAFSGELHILPEGLRIDNYALYLIIAGIALMYPLVGHILKIATGTKGRNDSSVDK